MRLRGAQNISDPSSGNKILRDKLPALAVRFRSAEFRSKTHRKRIGLPF